MYGHLLPFLNQKPLSASGGVPQSWLEQLPVPVAGDRSFAIMVEQSVRFALVLSGMEPADASWWSSLGLRYGLSFAVGRRQHDCSEPAFAKAVRSWSALAVQGLRAPAPAEFALLRVGLSSLARAAAKNRSNQEEVKAVIEAIDRKAVALEHAQRNSRSVQPPQLRDELWSAASKQDGLFSPERRGRRIQSNPVSSCAIFHVQYARPSTVL